MSDSPALEQRVRQLEDAEAIHTLFMRYGRCLDTKDWDTFATLFAETGELESVGGVGAAVGPTAIRAMFDTVLKDVPPAFHVFANERYEIDGERATAHSLWFYVCPGDDGWPRFLQFGHYEDVLTRGSGEWLFQRRLITRDMGFPPYRKP
jgi:hypothetical protein